MKNNSNEKVLPVNSGWGMLGLFFLLLGVSAAGFYFEMGVPAGILAGISCLILPGFVAIEPNSSRVCTLFGQYKGTVKDTGFKWMNPFYLRKNISQRARNLETAQVKVNDKMGNPIMIGAVVVWKVEDTYKAAFDVENFENFVNIQSEAAIRKLAGMYSYDNLEDEEAVITLRSSSEEVNTMLESEISERLQLAGITVMEARISHLAYSSEIAGAMLQRQQASAVVAARAKIVEGAVGMVEMALHKLSEKEIVHLDDERKAAMVSNLMVVLCSEKNTTPVINAGTLHT
jgi:regulator of protease activity HflC (stomatin/prohibitin superfamily)